MTISSTTGLVTGMNIASLVDSLMSIANQQYTRMETKQTELSNQSDAITVLSALVASTEYIVDLLGTSNTSSPFSQEDATSSKHVGADGHSQWVGGNRNLLVHGA